LFACQMPLRFGLPSAVRAARDTASAVERVISIPTAAPTARQTIEVTIVKLLKRFATSRSFRRV
jgi:hypothetical protein